MLDGGRPSDVVALEARNRANERMISHLNIQIDFLQQKNREMDRKMNEALATRDEYESMSSKMNLKTRQLEAKNKELEYDLNDVDRMAKRLQCDKEIVVKEADREMTEAKDELEKSRHELEDLDQVVAELKAGNQSLSRQQAELKQQLSVKNGDLLRLEELLDRVTEDKKRISHRVNKLMTNAMTQLFIFYSHDTILKNKVTFCDTPKDNTPPKASEQSVEQTITYSEILILDSPPAGHKNIKRTPR
ncbi:Hypothetical predicted protein [Mytilus galloprovincialis]|nr:Hypothetical predicted protein [Mytilus galloprovincialis]